jgi:HK97 family phage portal protein
LPLSAKDAQFVESASLSVREIGRMLGVPSGLLDDPEPGAKLAPEHENMRFLTYGIAPWQERIEQGLESDPDIVPDDSMCVEFDNRQLLRADLATRMNAAHAARQAGIATANELRPDFGLPGNHPDGNVLLATPVGGAPNEPAPSGNNSDNNGDSTPGD